MQISNEVQNLQGSTASAGLAIDGEDVNERLLSRETVGRCFTRGERGTHSAAAEKLDEKISLEQNAGGRMGRIHALS